MDYYTPFDQGIPPGGPGDPFPQKQLPQQQQQQQNYSMMFDPTTQPSDWNVSSGFSQDGAGPYAALSPPHLSPSNHHRSDSDFDPSAFDSSFVPPRFTTGAHATEYGLQGVGGASIVEPDSMYNGYGTVTTHNMGNNMIGYDSVGFQGSPPQQQQRQFGDRTLAAFAGGLTEQEYAGILAPAPTLHPQPQPPPSNLSGTSRPISTIGMMGPPPIPVVRRGSAPTSSRLQQQLARRQSFAAGAVSRGPVYAPYGSSTVAIPQTPSSKPLPAPALSSFSNNVSEASAPFDPASLGLPVPPAPGVASNWKGLYSTSGFDMLGVLARVAARPNPQLALGPVDMGCSFVVVDAKKWDQPIVFASETFSRLTGYTNAEIVGRNCRFLQSPTGEVRQGEKRKYTDGAAAYHLRSHLVLGKESQASLINYAKGGRPFINLVTIIPIAWDSDEIAYFVGFQVDLVDMPSAIMEKMKDGSYVVNYSLINAHLPRTLSVPSSESPFAPSTSSTAVSQKSITTGAPAVPASPDPGFYHPESPTVVQTPRTSTVEPMDVDQPSQLLDVVEAQGIKGLTSDSAHKQFNRLLLEHCDDFVHVVSLKGSLLYVSPSARQLLEYEPSELIGQTLSSFCHPSDIVSVLRELKEAGSASQSTVNIVYRIRRKHSGFVWMEASGRLHLEHGKGRKCVILVGRPRQVYRMSWAALERFGGFGEKEWWSKITLDGLYLYSTPTVESVLGISSEEMLGKNLTDICLPADVVPVLKSLRAAAEGEPTTVRHQLLTAKSGAIDVVTHFYSARSDSDEPTGHKSRPLTVIAQTLLFSSQVAKDLSHSLSSAPAGPSSSAPIRPSARARTSFALFNLSEESSLASGSDTDSTRGSGSSTTSFSAIPSTFKTLAPSAQSSDNIFDELEEARGTSWTYELHQMRLTNKKLREEKEALLLLQRKKRKRMQIAAAKTKKGSSVGSPTAPAASPSATSGQRACANCARTNSTEWRTGPTGPKTLCNACGLRWAKAAKASAHPPAPTPLQPTGASPSITPASSNETPTTTSTGRTSSSGSGGSGTETTVSPATSHTSSSRSPPLIRPSSLSKSYSSGDSA